MLRKFWKDLKCIIAYPVLCLSWKKKNSIRSRAHKMIKCKVKWNVQYASVVRSLMYAQTCIRTDISFDVGIIMKISKQSLMTSLEYCKESFEIVWRNKKTIVTYRHSDSLEIICYSDSYYTRCLDSRNQHQGLFFY